VKTITDSGEFSVHVIIIIIIIKKIIIKYFNDDC